mmetsp:Transcript_24850/g.38662  ORF Transcript_24850/g.38662 Transcript_24850/m.38662 type:complete len:142 (+) Transcript_24850:800-1225(+)
MKRYHNYEFKRNKGTLRCQILTIMICYNLRIIYAAILIFYSADVGDECETRHLREDRSPQEMAVTIINLFEEVLQVTSLFMVINLAVFKKSDDVLQGISKLDYLLKASIFQQYKDKSLKESDYLTVGHAQTFHRVSTVRGS